MILWISKTVSKLLASEDILSTTPTGKTCTELAWRLINQLLIFVNFSSTFCQSNFTPDFTPPFYTSFLHLYFYPIFTSSLYLFKLIFGPFSKPLYVHLKFMHYCFIYCLTLSSKNYVSLLITANCITVKFDALIAELNKNVTVKFKPLEIMYHEINAWNKKTDLFILSSLLTLVLEFIDGNHALETGALLLHRDACEVH